MLAMDPVTLIGEALLAGAATGSADVAAGAIRDTYTSLRDLVRRRSAGNVEAEVALDGHETDPEQWQSRLVAALAETDAGRDAETVAAAQRLMALLDPTGTRNGKYIIDLRKAKGVQVGDSNVQINRFFSRGGSGNERE